MCFKGCFFGVNRSDSGFSVSNIVLDSGATIHATNAVMLALTFVLARSLLVEWVVISCVARSVHLELELPVVLL